MSDTKIRARRKRWLVRYQTGNADADAQTRRMAGEVGISEILARLLFVRGYRTSDEALRFFRMETSSLHDPFLLSDMRQAVERLEKALMQHEKIAIYGDYDVDGVTSVSLLWLYLTALGADVSYYIPSRSGEGYGLSFAAMDRLHANGVTLIVTVDTGVTAVAEASYAASLGMDMVVTDHHECLEELPTVCAVVNPHRPGDRYPFPELAGVGVVFKLVCAMEMTRCRQVGRSEMDGVREICRSYADLVALGTVADVMPVTDENRLIISLGLRRMEQECRLGLRELACAAAGNGRPLPKITSTYIGYVLAPRMNAAGRVSSASIAVELLLENSKARAEELAARLCTLNGERQTEENRILQEAYRTIDQMPASEREYVLVLDAENWHQGVIGIVSSRITERYGLPSILISYGHGEEHSNDAPSPDDVGKGSGRSIKGLNLVEALSACSELLVRFGGHELAAGLSIRRGDVEAFRRRINAYAAERLTDEMLSVSMEADCELEMRELSLSLAEEIGRLEPFGVSNPVPCFLLRDAVLRRVVPMGGGKHIRMTLEKDGRSVSAVWFGRAPDCIPFETDDTVDLLFQLGINEYQGRTGLQLIVQDAMPSRTTGERYERWQRRYALLCGGAEFASGEEILPSREDAAAVYTFLRREFQAGHSRFSVCRLLEAMRTAMGKPMNYCKLRFVLRILQELGVCGVSEPEPEIFQFDIFPTAKTDLEKSSILHQLRCQQSE